MAINLGVNLELYLKVNLFLRKKLLLSSFVALGANYSFLQHAYLS